jgi:hypothetical protein
VRAIPPGVDHLPEVTAELIAVDFAGDADAAAEMYFRRCCVWRRTRAWPSAGTSIC